MVSALNWRPEVYDLTVTETGEDPINDPGYNLRARLIFRVRVAFQDLEKHLGKFKPGF